MAKWTTEMRETIDCLMDATCGGDWVEDGITEKQLETCCATCPFRSRCEAESLYFGCAVWEEMMGEDL